MKIEIIQFLKSAAGSNLNFWQFLGLENDYRICCVRSSFTSCCDRVGGFPLRKSFRRRTSLRNLSGGLFLADRVETGCLFSGKRNRINFFDGAKIRFLLQVLVEQRFLWMNQLTLKMTNFCPWRWTEKRRPDFPSCKDRRMRNGYRGKNKRGSAGNGRKMPPVNAKQHPPRQKHVKVGMSS